MLKMVASEVSRSKRTSSTIQHGEAFGRFGQEFLKQIVHGLVLPRSGFGSIASRRSTCERDQETLVGAVNGVGDVAFQTASSVAGFPRADCGTG